MKTIVVFSVILWVLLRGSASAAPLPPAEQSLRKVLDVGEASADLSLIPPEHREPIILRLREIAKKKTSSYMGTASINSMEADLLIRLGDKFTIESIYSSISYDL